jgi:hypothetical protein
LTGFFSPLIRRHPVELGCKTGGAVLVEERVTKPNRWLGSYRPKMPPARVRDFLEIGAFYLLDSSHHTENRWMPWV